MKAWRCVGLIGVPTMDGREIRGRVQIRHAHGGEPGPFGLIQLRSMPKGPEAGHIGSELVGLVPARVSGNEILVRLPWRHRQANLDLSPGSIDTEGDPGHGPWLCVLSDPLVLGVTLSGPSAWRELR